MSFYFFFSSSFLAALFLIDFTNKIPAVLQFPHRACTWLIASSLHLHYYSSPRREANLFAYRTHQAAAVCYPDLKERHVYSARLLNKLCQDPSSGTGDGWGVSWVIKTPSSIRSPHPWLLGRWAITPDPSARCGAVNRTTLAWFSSSCFSVCLKKKQI